jgi:hypothetical protein
LVTLQTAHGEFIEDNLLRIIRIVSIGLEFPIWLPLTESRIVRLCVVNIKPSAPFVLLCRNTIVEIVPAVGEGIHRSAPFLWPTTTTDDPFPWTSFVLDMFRRKNSAAEEEKMKKKSSRSISLPPEDKVLASGNPAINQKSVYLRVQEVWSESSSERDVVLASAGQFRPDVSLTDDLIVEASLKLIPSSLPQTENSPSFNVFLRLLGQKSSSLVASNHLGVTAAIMRKLNMARCDVVKITVTESSTQVYFFCYRNYHSI